MSLKLGKSVTVWMLKSIKTDSVLANNTQALLLPAYWLCPYDEICENEIIVSDQRKNIEQIARRWNEAHELHKVEPIKVRVSLEFLEEATDEK